MIIRTVYMVMTMISFGEGNDADDGVMCVIMVKWVMVVTAVAMVMVAGTRIC